MGFFYRSTEPDPVTGIIEDVYLGYGDDEGKVQFCRRQNVDEELRLAHESRAAAPNHFNGTDGLYKSASVPMVEMERWKTDYGFDWFQATPKERKAWMNKYGNRWKMRDVVV